MSPALLEGAQVIGTTVCEAEVSAQALVEGALALARLWPVREGDPTQMALERRIPRLAAGGRQDQPDGHASRPRRGRPRCSGRGLAGEGSASSSRQRHADPGR